MGAFPFFRLKFAACGTMPGMSNVECRMSNVECQSFVPDGVLCGTEFVTPSGTFAVQAGLIRRRTGLKILSTPKPRPAPTARSDKEENVTAESAGQTLAKLDHLTDEEVNALLNAMLPETHS